MVEFRKLINFGKTSYVISLPKTWIKKNNMKKGDLISVNEEDGGLVLFPRNTESENEIIQKTELDVSSMDSQIITRVIHGIYKKGIDEITVRFQKPEQLRTIQTLLSEGMIGFEIIKQEQNYCVIRAIARTFEEEFDSMLRRTFLVQKSMLSGLSEILGQKDKSTISSIRHLEKINNRYTGFCRRVLNRKSKKGKENITFLYAFITELERIADECKYVCDYVNKLKNLSSVNKNTIEVYKQLFDYFNSVYENFYKFDLMKTSDSLSKSKALITNAQKMMEASSKIPYCNIVLAHHCYVVSQKISNMLSLIIKMKI